VSDLLLELCMLGREGRVVSLRESVKELASPLRQAFDLSADFVECAHLLWETYGARSAFPLARGANPQS
jgi:hypothetical protein